LESEVSNFRSLNKKENEAEGCYIQRVNDEFLGYDGVREHGGQNKEF
jgi:hypothetical protein